MRFFQSLQSRDELFSEVHEMQHAVDELLVFRLIFFRILEMPFGCSFLGDPLHGRKVTFADYVGVVVGAAEF